MTYPTRDLTGSVVAITGATAGIGALVTSMISASVITLTADAPAVLEGKSIAAKELIRIARRIAGIDLEREAGTGLFARIGRALGLSASPT